jgi:hypothetical protein
MTFAMTRTQDIHTNPLTERIAPVTGLRPPPPSQGPLVGERDTGEVTHVGASSR